MSYDIVQHSSPPADKVKWSPFETAAADRLENKPQAGNTA